MKITHTYLPLRWLSQEVVNIIEDNTIVGTVKSNNAIKVAVENSKNKQLHIILHVFNNRLVFYLFVRCTQLKSKYLWFLFYYYNDVMEQRSRWAV